MSNPTPEQPRSPYSTHSKSMRGIDAEDYAGIDSVAHVRARRAELEVSFPEPRRGALPPIGICAEGVQATMFKMSFDSTVSLTFNFFSGEYACAEDWWQDEVDNGCEDGTTWLSAPEREKALQDNSIWCLVWYPEGQMNSSEMCASSLPALMAWVEAHHGN